MCSREGSGLRTVDERGEELGWEQGIDADSPGWYICMYAGSQYSH